MRTALGRTIAVRDVPSGGGAGTLAYLLADHLGSTVEALDAAGNTIAGSEIKYWPYGGTRAGGVPQTDKLYTGQQQEPGDAALGLYNYKARFYSTVLGRFVSADPLTVDGLNRYAYVRNNPLRYTDPSGLCATIGEVSLPCEAGDFINWLDCAMNCGGNWIGDVARDLIGTTEFWQTGGGLFGHIGGYNLHHRTLDVLIKAAWGYGPRALARIPQAGWDVIGGMFGVGGAFFKASLHDLLYGTDTVSSLPLGAIVGASEWWDDVTLLIWKAHWDSKYGSPFDLSNGYNVGTQYMRMTRLAGQLLPGTNERPWSDDQLLILDADGIDVDESLARLYRERRIECVLSPSTYCNPIPSWR